MDGGRRPVLPSSSTPPWLAAASDAVVKRKRDVGGGEVAAATTVLQLPGGRAHTKTSSGRTLSDEVPDAIAYGVRAYLDELFGTIMLQVRESNDSVAAIPIVVHNILRYNNIHFDDVELYVTPVALPEPLWFTYEVAKSRLSLFLNETMYKDYCADNSCSDVPVVWSGGHALVDRYNPYGSHPEVSELETAKIKCALVCDHVAQHIIHRYYYHDGGDDDDGPPPTANTGLHEGRWTRHGVTLHSMLDIEIVESPCGERRQQQHGSQVLAMLPFPGVLSRA